MALQALAPSEKSEHLIYSILPLSVAVWITSQFNIANPLDTLAIITSIATFGVLLLYEITPDEWAINKILRWRTHSRESLDHAILVLSSLVRIWEYEPTSFKDRNEDYIDEQKKVHINITISDPRIRKRIWRIRASAYVFISLYFIMNAAWNYLTSFTTNNTSISNWYIDTYLSGAIVLYIISLAIFLFVSLYRHRHLTSSIDHLSRYSYLKRLISVQKIRKPEIFEAERKTDDIGRLLPSYQTLDKEIQLLTTSLVQDEWADFLHRWDHVYRWLHRDAVEFMEEFIAFDLMNPFAQTYSKKRKGNAILDDDPLNRIAWVIYFIEKATIFKSQENPILQLPSIEPGVTKLVEWAKELTIDEFEDPNSLLKKASEIFPFKENTTTSAVLWAIAHVNADIIPEHFAMGRMQREGWDLLVRELTTSKHNLDPSLCTIILLHAHEGEGCGVVRASSLFRNHLPLMKMKELQPSNLTDQWEKAMLKYMTKFTTTSEHESLMLLLKETEFLRPILESSTRIRDAFSVVKERCEDYAGILALFENLGL